MNHRHVFNLCTLAALGFAMLPGGAVAQQKSLKEQIVGTWSVVSWEQTLPDGSKLQRFGANPKGINMFDANGRVFVMFVRPDLPRLSSNNLSTPTPEEAKAIVAGSIAYYGTYTVDEAAKTVSLRLEGTTFQNQLGMEQKRNIVSLTADELKYSNPTPTAGGQITVALKRLPTGGTN
jgi:hypothetical protein